MWFREVVNARRRTQAGIAGLLAAAPLLLGACGEDDFPNESRPPSPVELTAAIDDRSVSISPSTVGAGIVIVTISNQTDEPTRLTLEGPGEPVTSSEIPPGATGSIKTTLEEGDYEAAAGAEIGIKPADLEVGPERETSQNDLLQP
jgi:hypothetical protein